MEELQTLKSIAEMLNQANDLTQMLPSVLKELLHVTGITSGWIFLMNEKGDYTLAADYNLPEGLLWKYKKPMCEGSCWCVDKYQKGRLNRAANIMECKRIENVIEHSWGDTEGITHHATVPLRAGNESFGLLNVASPNKTYFSQEELALLEAIAFQIGTAIKRIQLTQKEQELALIAERNRLARDLHDSVNQLLFSLMLTVRGTQEMTNEPEVKEMLSYIQELSQEALQEMRALIWQLRPQGLEDGIGSALCSYGKVLGLEVQVEVKGVLELPSKIEEAMWRIGQEALNNCKKHAVIKACNVEIQVKDKTVIMTVRDEGCGFHYTEGGSMPTLGLAGMKERAEFLGGSFNVISKVGVGTSIQVNLPI
ncbi:GAF domain-containing sensor histidine kinase [Bacillus sp. RD4P76]|uniref:histidine kinase n=2 Tax=Bacillus suaedaesalsae TaxID=2810349 RepID=A0ABS2DF11_9BACI|nr:GAF domain-containing sensor histidine kinase [Bacillus suaedaesalsae]